MLRKVLKYGLIIAVVLYFLNYIRVFFAPVGSYETASAGGYKRKTIMLDPNNGKDELAQTLINFQLNDEDMLLEIASGVEKYLNATGKYFVYKTRTSSDAPTDEKRANLANFRRPDAFISIKKLGGLGFTAGYAVMYSEYSGAPSESKLLAESIGESLRHNNFRVNFGTAAQSLIPLYPLVFILLEAIGAQPSMMVEDVNSGVYRSAQGTEEVLDLNQQPAIIIYPGNFSNTLDVARMKRKEFPIELGRAIDEGLSNYFAKTETKH